MGEGEERERERRERDCPGLNYSRSAYSKVMCINIPQSKEIDKRYNPDLRSNFCYGLPVN